MLGHSVLCCTAARAKGCYQSCEVQRKNCSNENFRGDPIIGPQPQSNQKGTLFLNRFWARISQPCCPSVLNLQWCCCGGFKLPSFEVICYRATGNAMSFKGRCSAQGVHAGAREALAAFPWPFQKPHMGIVSLGIYWCNIPHRPWLGCESWTFVIILICFKERDFAGLLNHIPPMWWHNKKLSVCKPKWSHQQHADFECQTSEL